MNLSEKEFTDLIENNEVRLRHVSRVYAQHPEEEKDIYQEIVIQIWRSVNSFDGKARIDTWIYRLAINTAISFTRRKKTRQKYYTAFRREQQKKKRNEYEYAERVSKNLSVLYSAISKLNPSEKAIITMYLDDFSYSEIAFVTNITENNVGVKLHRIKQKLSNIIGKNNGT